MSVRPDPQVWSPLEYACHVHDVHQLFHERIILMLDVDVPQFANWDQDTTAIEKQYDQQVPQIVGPTLVAAAYAVADMYATVSGEDWDRAGVRSDGAVFTIGTLGRYHLHDVVHHLHDVSVLASRVTVASYEAYADDYAAGTAPCPTPSPPTSRVSSPGSPRVSRVLEIGSGPGRDALALEHRDERAAHRHHAGVRPAAELGRLDRRVVDPLRDDLTDPLRDGTPYDAVWANASLLHVRRDSLPVVLRRLAAVTRPGARCTSRSRRATVSAGRCTATWPPRASSPTGARSRCARR